MDKSAQKTGNEKKTVVQEIVSKISGADSVLVTLPQNPSVDVLAGAIGLTLAIDKMGKRATAIYSGETPNALDFLRPEETFDKDAVGLQDFVIAINKDKADHLRYKLDGDYVKVFVTPYKTSISERDLEFSYGDFNVDLVIALDVESEGNLDSALTEYGRILHDASIVNICLSTAGTYGDTVWTEPGASSICEMLTGLLGEMANRVELDQDMATALLTGIVARTERFSNALTTPEAMTCAARLMSAGADQQLINANMMEVLASNANRYAPEPAVEQAQSGVPIDPSVMDIQHKGADGATGNGNADAQAQTGVLGEALAQAAQASVNNATDVESQRVVNTPMDKRVLTPPADGGGAGKTSEQTTEDVIASIIAGAGGGGGGNVSAPSEGGNNSEVQNIINGIKNNFQENPLGVSDIDVDQVIEKSVADTVLDKGNAAPVAEPKMPTGKEGEFIGGNPALLATPGVNNAPVPDVPTMSFDNAVTERKEKVLPEESYLKAPDAKLEQPKTLDQSRVVVQPVNAPEKPVGVNTAVGANVPANAIAAANGLANASVSGANVLPLPTDATAAKIPTPPPLSL